MLPTDFDYVAPDSLDEAVGILADDPDARVLAGGQSLIPLLKMRLAAPSRLVDLGRLDELRYVRREDDEVAVGALTPHAEVASSGELGGGLRALAEAARSVGDAQVRNRGTLGGSLAHADPSADLPAAVLALDATLVARGPDGERTIDAADFFHGLWTTALGSDEILTEIRFPAGARSAAAGAGGKATGTVGGAYRKLKQKASGFALVGAAAVVETDGDTCRRAAVGITGAGHSPLRLPDVEQALAGGPLTEERVREACDGAGGAVDAPQDDVHGSADYRRAMTGVMARRAVLEAAG